MQLFILPQKLRAQCLGEGEEESLQVLGSSRMCVTQQSNSKNFIHVSFCMQLVTTFEIVCIIFDSVLLDMIYYSTTLF